MIAILDYRMGNLRSVQKAIEKLGADAQVVDTPDQVASASKLILPGVGAFADAMIHLRQQNLVDTLRAFAASGKPFLGICLGLQLLFDVSREDGEHEGLGIIPGRVEKFIASNATIRVPHMGWNRIEVTPGDRPLLADLPADPHVYFVHSYYAVPADESDVAAWAEYDGQFCASIQRDNIYATQFHPEKSQRVGANILRNFINL